MGPDLRRDDWGVFVMGEGQGCCAYGGASVMTEDQIIALVGFSGVAIGALLSGLITFFIAGKRNNLEARIEICKYREKWLSDLREEIAQFNAKTMLYSLANKESKEAESAFEEIMIRQWRILLAIPKSNSFYEEVQASMREITSRMLNENDPKLGYEVGVFIGISKEVLTTEWNEIQNLLHKKKAK